jgi:hypothetical protein
MRSDAGGDKLHSAAAVVQPPKKQLIDWSMKWNYSASTMNSDLKWAATRRSKYKPESARLTLHGFGAS